LSTHPIPLGALEHHIGILGKTGSGKSFAAQGAAERIIARKERICIIDPTDRYWGLRLDADGKRSSGYEIVIFGGGHGDLPLAATHGSAIAEIVGTSTTPAILSTRHMTVGERTRFFIDFAETLVQKNSGPLHLIIDEAHLFAPQTRVTSIESGKLLHATNNLVSLGRGLGLRIMLLSQRPAKLHKDSLTQVETLIAMRMIAPQDRNAIDAWVEDWADEDTGEEIKASLPSLPTGDAWLWAPELDILKRVHFPEIATYDSGKPTPAGRKGPQLQGIDLEKVRGKLEIVAKEAVENDPKRLKAQIADLKRQLAKPAEQAAAEDPAALKDRMAKAREDGWRRGYAKGFDEASLDLAGIAGALDRALSETRDTIALLEKLKAEIDPFRDKRRAAVKDIAVSADRGDATRPAQARPAPRPAVPPAPRPARLTNGSGADGAVTPARQKILDALAILASIGIAPADKTQLALFIKVSPTSGGYFNNLGALRSLGLIEYPQGGTVVLTNEGRAAAAPPDAPPTTADLHATIAGLLPPAKWKLLEQLIGIYPDAIAKDELAERVGVSPTSGGYFNNLGSLRSLGLIDYPSGGQVVAKPVLFLEQ
jgi:uncharacterized protein